MLTNFSTIRKSIKHLQNIDKMESDGTFEKITKKERLQLTRERDKLRKVLDGIEHMNKMPGALFIVDIKKESIAVKEAHRLNIPIFAIVDTNCDPDEVDYVIPANDDAVRAVELIINNIANTIQEGTLKAKELKAQENAEKERIRKEREEDRKDDKDVKVKFRRVKPEARKGKRPETGTKTEAPKTEAPKAEAPKAEAPKTEEVKKEEK